MGNVIPGRDPESRKHHLINKLVAYTGFRVPARNDITHRLLTDYPQTSYVLEWLHLFYTRFAFCNVLIANMLQKATFCVVKDRLLAHER